MTDWFGNTESVKTVAEPKKKAEKAKYQGTHRDPDQKRGRRVKVIYESDSPTAKLDQKKIDKIDPSRGR